MEHNKTNTMPCLKIGTGNCFSQMPIRVESATFILGYNLSQEVIYSQTQTITMIGFDVSKTEKYGYTDNYLYKDMAITLKKTQTASNKLLLYKDNNCRH